MRIRINFSANTEPLTKPVNDYVNGFIHKCLGENNKWHDAFSPYCVSQMHGGVLDKNTGLVQYPNGGYIIVSVDESGTEFANKLIDGLFDMTDGAVQTMKYVDFQTYGVKTQPKYDITRIECVRLKEGKRHITCKDGDFTQKLNEHVVRKLKRCGVSDSDAESVRLEPFHSESWRVKYVKVTHDGNTVTTPSSNVMYVVKGSKAARERILSLGYGQSTGSGFGFPFTKEDNNN